MSGIQFVTDEKGRKVAVQIDLRKYGDRPQDFLGWADFRMAPQGEGCTAENAQSGPHKTRPPE